MSGGGGKASFDPKIVFIRFAIFACCSKLPESKYKKTKKTLVRRKEVKKMSSPDMVLNRENKWILGSRKGEGVNGYQALSEDGFKWCRRSQIFVTQTRKKLPRLTSLSVIFDTIVPP